MILCAGSVGSALIFRPPPPENPKTRKQLVWGKEDGKLASFQRFFVNRFTTKTRRFQRQLCTLSPRTLWGQISLFELGYRYNYGLSFAFREPSNQKTFQEPDASFSLVEFFHEFQGFNSRVLRATQKCSLCGADGL